MKIVSDRTRQKLIVPESEALETLSLNGGLTGVLAVIEFFWRIGKRSAPQFHENLVLARTFAFNLLMGRHWPPSPVDLQEAETLIVIAHP